MRHHLFTAINIVFILTVKRALYTICVALWFVEVSCRAEAASPVRSAVNGLWFCCGIILGLFLAGAGPHSLLFRLKSAAGLWRRSVVQSTELRGEHTHTQCTYSTGAYPPQCFCFFLFWSLLPLTSSCGREKPFPVTFHLLHEHLFPPSCYCLPTQEVSHKCQENESGSLCVRWWRGGSVRLWAELAR